MKKTKSKKADKIDTKHSPFVFDTTKTYIVPMRSVKDRLNRHVEAEPVECHIRLKDRSVIIVERPDIIFHDNNFDWYLHIGYIKVKEDD